MLHHASQAVHQHVWSLSVQTLACNTCSIHNQSGTLLLLMSFGIQNILGDVLLLHGPIQTCTSVKCTVLTWFMSYRVEASNPQLPVPPAASSSPARDSASQALWSPDTPEYVPHFTCCYEDTPAEQEAGEMQSVPSQEPVSYTTATAEKALDSLGSGKAVAPKPTGYGSSSFAPLAGRRSAT